MRAECSPVVVLHIVDLLRAEDVLLGVETVQTGGEVTEVPVSQGLLRRDPPAGPGLQHQTDQLLPEGKILQPRPDPAQRDRPVVGQLVRPVVRQAGHPGPHVLRGSAHHPEYLVQLVEDVPDSREAGVAVEHLYQDTAGAPDVQTGGVVGGAQQDVRRPVPERHHLVRERVGRHRLGSGQTEVGQLELPRTGDEEVLRLDVSVEDPAGVTEGEAAQELKHEELDVPLGEAARVVLQVLGQVRPQVLEHQGQAGLGVDDVVEGHDVGVLQVLQQTRLPDGREGGPLLLLQPDLLQRHHLVGQVAEASEHGGVAALAQLLQLDVGLQLAVGRVPTEGGVSLRSCLVVSVEKDFRFRAGRSPWSSDNTGHDLLLDFLVQQSRV